MVLPQRPGSAPGETRRPLAVSPGVAWLRLGPLRRMPHVSRQREGQTLGAPGGTSPGAPGDTCKAGPRRALRQHGEGHPLCGGHKPSAVRGRPGRRSEKRPWDVGLLLSEDSVSKPGAGSCFRGWGPGRGVCAGGRVVGSRGEQRGARGMGAVEDVYELKGRTAEAPAARGSGGLTGAAEPLRLSWTSAVSHDGSKQGQRRIRGGAPFRRGPVIFVSRLTFSFSE